MSTFNIEAVKTAMAASGFSPASLAKAMEVSRESVSKWLNGEATPRPEKLLKLSILLKLSRATLLDRPEKTALQPQVAFRMSRGKHPQDHHVARARHMGKMLEALVPHLPFDQLRTPPLLKNPSSGYDYLQSVASAIRKEMGVSETGSINIATLANLFRKLQAVIVPVLWGHRKGHENAIHVYLPKTATTWIYLNLDSRLADVKFWLAHELGHTYTFTVLQGDAGEDFADGFAGAILFPDAACKSLYEELSPVRSIHQRVQRVQAVGEAHEISMICVGKQLDKYAERHSLRKLIDDHKALYQINEMSKPSLASEAFFGRNGIDLQAMMSVGESVFRTPVYCALRSYLREKNAGPGYVQGILDCSLVDARQIVAELA